MTRSQPLVAAPQGSGSQRTWTVACLVLALLVGMSGGVAVVVHEDPAPQPSPTETAERAPTTTATTSTALTSTAPTSTAPTTTAPGTRPPISTTKPPSTTATTSPPATTTTAPSGPCGSVTIPKASGGTWTCTFADEFNGRSLDRTKWVPLQTAYSTFTSGNECYVDDPDNISVANGTLRITARLESAPVSCGLIISNVTTASVSTRDKFSQTFGRFEIRAKFQAVSKPVAGLHGALWLWPLSTKYGGWPASGEIDIAEVYSVQPDRAAASVHYSRSGQNTSPPSVSCSLDPAAFHTYVAEWTNTSIRILYDGKVCLDHKIMPAAPLVAPQPFDHPFFVVLTQALGAIGGPNPFNGSVTPLPATMHIDYVRAWK